MKILVISDSHLYEDYLPRVIKKYKNKVDYIIHCGDSSLSNNDSLLKQMDIVVLGNHDIIDLPKYKIINNFLITHGHFFNVYHGYEQLIQICKDNHCTVCLHGHTHVPTHQVHDGIHFINPGSLMMNRGSYGYGTYALLEYHDQAINVSFFHHITDELCSEIILNEGLELLEEFKKLV
ncbi:MAG: YfcE family phosphodiesterase [Coprobacillus sp.]